MNNHRIAVIGQGYVGLPLALEFAKHFPVYGFDINTDRVKELNSGKDRTLEADLTLLSEVINEAQNSDFSKGYIASASLDTIKDANIYIVTVPTPIDKFNAPDLGPLLGATKMLAEILKKGDIVIYESTVYPGCTEEDCVPLLENISGLKYNEDFYVGYSPERINPGDKVNTLTTIKKVTSGSTPEIAEIVDTLYKKIITAGTHKAANIKVAEASKAIENAQRDINISFVNELALIFDRVGIDTNDVLEAAGTKFNFLKYKPGLVGGHCISVDPYYLAHKASQLGYHPQVILSGRRVNNSMAEFIASKVVKLMIKKGISISNANVLILGITFKENCPDVRNTKVVDVYKELEEYGLHVDMYDPWADRDEVKQKYKISMLENIDYNKKYDTIVLAVSHDEFLTLDLNSLRKETSVVFDIKAKLDRDIVDARL
ncbi:nucleotide sugar dehydrogenase [Elizabethkingia ursingii]|jgi:UDP-N-acetyl-D-galactosamine dehydrogenase|uniref:Vi polysaccharide biosynthesis protein VipA/TviB n=1 Tax=Elizabethkingia ursingii TaxID=1756150 RepID=A0AAJ3TN64_9FLAO|nr:nucleotide sugar dehydrogenase [Elizabethkingia ursingii]AQX07869.1 Vi polysaccharide biosynthesis protein VipA/TviB [Elizabethkingia ursingii]OPB73780.1 Vi polysaccharide biosynthesis protein VipA/TviB [Elizabethkingia ursingii]